MMNENTTVFGASIAGEYDSLDEVKFSTEKQMQQDIEANLNVFFEDLKFLASEVTIGGDRVDTVAYDSSRNCFVIIEYKNVKSESVLNQCIAYQQKMKDHKTDLVLLYNHNQKKHHAPRNFDWDEAYVIIISPEFTRYQIQGKDSLHNIELRKISMHERGIIILERMNGEPHVRHEEADEKIEDAPANTPDMENLLYDLKENILNKINVYEYRAKHFLRFYAKSQRLICGIDVKKSHIDVLYAVKEVDNILAESEFVRTVDVVHWKRGEYASQIRDHGDIKKAVRCLQKVYDYKERT